MRRESPRRNPRPIGGAIAAFADRLAPATPLSEIQRVWEAAVGPAIVAQAQPTAERGGVVTVTCATAVWAQELDLMSPDIIARLNAALAPSTGVEVRSLRCQSVPARSWSRGAGG